MKLIYSTIIILLLLFISTSYSQTPSFLKDCKNDTLIKSKILINSNQMRTSYAAMMLYSEQYQLTKEVFEVVIYQDSLNKSLKYENDLLTNKTTLQDTKINEYKELVVSKDKQISELNKKNKWYGIYKITSAVAITTTILLLLLK